MKREIKECVCEGTSERRDKGAQEIVRDGKGNEGRVAKRKGGAEEGDG